MQSVNRRLETFSREEWSLLRASGMMWVFFPEAPIYYDELNHKDCECTGTMSRTCELCARACGDNSQGGESP